MLDRVREVVDGNTQRVGGLINRIKAILFYIGKLGRKAGIENDLAKGLQLFANENLAQYFDFFEGATGS